MDSTRIILPKELLVPAGFRHYEGDCSLGTIESGPDTYVFDQPCRWEADLTNTGGAILVQGSTQASAITSCARCLSPARVDLTGTLECYYLLADAAKPEDAEDDEIEIIGPDETIDLEPLIRASLILEFPRVPLCKPDCKGLCPDCGVNLNEETCDCAAKRAEEALQDVNNPFAVLKRLEVDDDNRRSADR